MSKVKQSRRKVARKHKPKQHFQLRWNIFNAVEEVVKFEAIHGVGTPLDIVTLTRIYSGNMLEAINSKRIENKQYYGVTFYAKLKHPDGQESQVEDSIRLDMVMSINQFISGTHSKTGHRYWQGAGDFWLEMMDNDYPDYECLDAWAVANCLAEVLR